jgi:universal stress protein F
MNRILVGLDASPRSPEVLEAAQALALRAGARLLLFRAVGLPIEVPHEAFSMAPGAVADLLRKNATDYLTGLLERVPPELRLGVVVGIGTPWQAICTAAEENNADLVVIGSHGYSGIDRLIGTTAAKVVNHARCSVLVVRHLSL